MKGILKNCSVLSHLVTTDGSLILALVNDELSEERVQHTILVKITQSRVDFLTEQSIFPWLCAGILEVDGVILVVGWGGQILKISALGLSGSMLSRSDGNPVSIVRNAKSLFERAYVVGMERQVYEILRHDEWKSIDDSMYYSTCDSSNGFHDFYCDDQGSIVCVGSYGEIWIRSKDGWSQVSSPTSVHLYSICKGSDSYFYVGGAKGTLLRGKNSEWEVIESNTAGNIWSMASSLNTIYFTSDEGIHQLDQAESNKVDLELVDYPNFIASTCIDDRFWFIGSKKIVCSSNNDWFELEFLPSEAMEENRIFGFITGDFDHLYDEYFDE